MKIIAGLGNPGSKYSSTRHNVGFMLLDFLANKHSSEFNESSKYNSEIATLEFENDKVILIKPGQYMNLSGVPIAKLVNFYKIPAENLLVIHDDLDIEFGKYKITLGKGPKQHNGITSIENQIGKSFNRLRFGVDSRDTIERQRIKGRDYVLSRFSDAELAELNEIFEIVYELIKDEFLWSDIKEQAA